MRSVHLVLGLFLAAAGSADAQQSRRARDYWSFYLLPYPSYNAIEGLGVYLVGGWTKPAPPGPIPVGIAIQPTAVLTTSGTRGLQLLYDNSSRWPGWRLLLIGGVMRAQRAPYFGLGNGALMEDSLLDEYGARYYRYSLLRTTATAALRRRVAGPLHVQVGAQWRHYRALPLDGRTRLGDDLTAGAPADTGRADNLEVRGGILLDTRDEEASPSRGVFLEALVGRGLRGPGDLEYTRLGFGAREFVSLSERFVLGLRQSVELAEGDIPFWVSHERMTSWRPEEGFGGPTTLRMHLPGRWAGPDKALASIDIRYKHWDYQVTPTMPVRLWLLAFADAGRVWLDGERFRLSGLHTGYGVGARLQVSRGSLFGFDVGWTPADGFNFASAVAMGF